MECVASIMKMLVSDEIKLGKNENKLSTRYFSKWTWKLGDENRVIQRLNEQNEYLLCTKRQSSCCGVENKSVLQ